MGGLNFPSLDSAIARFENVNPALNNPGGVTQQTANYYWPGATSAAGPGSSCPGCAVFPSFEAGQQAQDAIVTGLANSGLSLADFIHQYSGATGQTLQNYTNLVSQSTGIAPSAPANSAPSSAPNPSAGCSWYDFACHAGLTVPTGKQTSGAPVFSFGRIVAVLLGLLFIGAGLIILAAQGVVGVAESKHVRTISRAAAIAA
jgi:hypothetical protein